MTDYELFIESDLETIKKFITSKPFPSSPTSYKSFRNSCGLRSDPRWYESPDLRNFYSYISPGSLDIEITFTIDEDFGFGKVESTFSLTFQLDTSKKVIIKRKLFTSMKNLLCLFREKCSPTYSKSPIELGFKKFKKDDKVLKDIDRKKSIKDIISDIKERVLNIKPSVDELIKFLKSKDFIETYNSVYNIPFRKDNEKCVIDSLFGFPSIIGEIMSLSPLRLPNLMETILICKEGIDPTEINFWDKVDKLVKEKSESAKGARMYEKLQREFYQGILELQQELCGKYDIDPTWLDHISYFLEEDRIILSNKSKYNLKEKRDYSSSSEIFPSTREDLLNSISKNNKDR